jgi:hypothetical protein
MRSKSLAMALGKRVLRRTGRSEGINPLISKSKLNIEEFAIGNLRKSEEFHFSKKGLGRRPPYVCSILEMNKARTSE